MLEWTNQVRHFNSVSIVAHVQWQPWPWHPGLWALSNLRSWILTRSAASLSPRLVQIGPDCLRNPRGPQWPQREAQRRPQGSPLEIPGDSPDLSHRCAKPCEPSEPRPLFQVFMTIWYSQKMSLLVKAPLLQAARAAGPCLRPHPKHPGGHSPISPIDPYVSGGMAVDWCPAVKQKYVAQIWTLKTLETLTAWRYDIRLPPGGMAYHWLFQLYFDLAHFKVWFWSTSNDFDFIDLLCIPVTVPTYLFLLGFIDLRWSSQPVVIRTVTSSQVDMSQQSVLWEDVKLPLLAQGTTCQILSAVGFSAQFTRHNCLQASHAGSCCRKQCDRSRMEESSRKTASSTQRCSFW